MGLTEAYAAQLRKLLPPGKALRAEPGTFLHGLLMGLAEELVRIGGRGAALLDEADPREAVETIEDWERMLGLPDPCVGVLADTLSERQAAIVQKYTARGGQTEAFYVALAAQLGYEATVQTFTPCRSGQARSGDRCYGPQWAYAFQVTVTGVEGTRARAGSARAGDRLAGHTAIDLECILARARPAHTYFLFAFN